MNDRFTHFVALDVFKEPAHPSSPPSVTDSPAGHVGPKVFVGILR